MIKKLFFIFLFFQIQTKDPVATAEPSWLGAWAERTWQTTKDEARSWYNWAAHSTTTTKAHTTLSLLHTTFCFRNDCKKLLDSYITNYPLTEDASLKKRVAAQTTQKAYIRVGSQVSEQEENFRTQRMAHIARSFKEVFPTVDNSDDSYIPTISICASGGGFRAMFASLGMLEALQGSSDTPGVIDTIMYMSCLSGSTWALIPHAVGLPLQALWAGLKKYSLIPVDLNPTTINKLKNNPFVFPPSCSYPDTFMYGVQEYECNYYNNNQAFQDNIMRAFLARRPLSFVSVYGSMIAHMILSGFDDPEIHDDYCPELPKQSRQQVLFSQAQQIIEKNNCSVLPLPLATTVSPLSSREARLQKTKGSPYLWVEVSPYEIGFDFYTPDHQLSGAYVPIWAAERFFKRIYNSKNRSYSYESQDHYPEPPLSYFLGIFGSAFAFEFTDLLRIGFNIDQDTEGIKGIVGQIIDKLTVMVLLAAPQFYFFTGHKTRLFPAELPNYGIMPESPFYGNTHTTVIDAGIAYNLPVYPIMKRKSDIIIMLDASANVMIDGAQELLKAERHMRQLELPFPQVAGTQAFNDAHIKAYTIFDKYKTGETGPTILYIPVAGKDADFNVQTCLEGDCDTFNFNYHTNSMTGLSQFMKKRVEEAIKELPEIIKKIQQKHNNNNNNKEQQKTVVYQNKKIESYSLFRRIAHTTKKHLRKAFSYLSNTIMA